MHVLGALLAVIGVVFAVWWRLREAQRTGSDMLDAGGDIRATVRRLMYKARHDVHPTDSVDDPRLAAAGIVVAVATMDAPISQAEIEALSREAQQTFKVTEREALDIVSFGRWIADQCNTNGEAVRRLSKVVAKEAGPEAGPDLIRMITEVATAGGGTMGDDELDALDTVRKALGVD